MSKRFLHMADVHLGYREYHLKARARDIALAFRAACRAAHDQKCDFMLVSGDLFHGGMTATAFLQGVLALPHDIPLYVIPGNHDGPKPGEGLSWLDVLAHLRDVTVLDVGISDGKLDLTKAVAELLDARIVGIPYLGMGVAQVIPQIAEYLGRVPRKYTVLMMHCGLEGEMPGFREPLTMDALEPLRGLVDYVALGHLHKPFQRDNWVFNPGSMEALSVDEVEWPGGWHIVDVDGLEHQVEVVPYDGRRHFERLVVDVTDLAGSESLHRIVSMLSFTLDVDHGAMLELTLRGRLRFPRAALDLPGLKLALTGDHQPLRAWVRDMTTGQEADIETQEGLSRTEMELDVLTQLVARDRGISQGEDSGYVAVGHWAKVLLEIKALALAKAEPKTVVGLVQALNERLGEEQTCKSNQSE